MFSIKKIRFYIVISLLTVFLFSLQAAGQQQFLTQGDLKRLDPRLHGVVVPYMEGLRKAEVPIMVKAVGQKKDGTRVYSGVVYTKDISALLKANVHVNSVYPDFVTARFTPGELAVLTDIESVIYIDAGELYYPVNDVAAGAVGSELVKGGYVNSTAYKGSGVIVCIIDTGIDWSHEDFRDPLDPSQSRIVYIWDQTLTAEGSETTPEDRDATNYNGLNYGVEYSNTQIEDEIDGSPAGFVRANDTRGHGTHVAGTAAGNGSSLSTRNYEGMAPEADLLIIKSGNNSFLNTFLIDALTYAQQVASEQGKPIVVNMSLGGHANAHDGTESLDVAVDTFADVGRTVVIAAGNEGNNAIHISGSIASGSATDIYFTVPSYTPNDGTDNDYFKFDLWFDTGGDVTALVTTPNSKTANQEAQDAGTTETPDGSIYLYNYVDSNNNDRHVRLEVDDNNAIHPPAAGQWNLNIQNNSESSMMYHGWFYTSSMDASLNSGDTDYTVASPGTAAEAITAGSYVSRWRWSDFNKSAFWYGSADRSDDISSFSSIGPTRDGRQKPDITAPGQGIGSSLSASISTEYIQQETILPGMMHYINQGTSMSCPVTAGCAALLLEIDPTLNASQIKSLITSTAMTDSYTGSTLPDNFWGYGKLDIFAAAAKAFNSGSSQKLGILAYDEWIEANSVISLGINVKAAVSFTYSASCQMAGLFIHPGESIDISDSVYAEIWSDNGSGFPDTKLGSSVAVHKNKILPYSWNYIDMTETGVPISQGTDYHAVIYFTSGSTESTFDIIYESNQDGSRSSLNSGTGWSAWDNADFRIRPVISTEQGGVLLAAKVFLEGPYDADGNIMFTVLGPNNYDVIPLTSPYSEDPQTVTAIPDNVTDWVLVQLRTSKTGSAVFSRSAFLHKDGSIVADDGVTNQIELNVDPGDYYIVIQHRNHLAVMSDEVHSLSSSGSTVYDFTTGTGKYEGADAAYLEEGVYGMYAGDASGNDQVQNDDKNDYWKVQVGLAGYRSADFNLNGEVQNDDKNDIWKSNVGRGTQVSGL